MATALQQQIAQAVRMGMDLEEIEETIIGPASVDEDEQAALWLYAEALVARPRLRRESALVSG